ncbi:MAG: hypothetical protein HKN22_03885 [Bacteroidia bacterium]|nr:hypothetical protein [Bacteroidia bacterium]
MNFNLKINSIKTISEISDYWSKEDYRLILEEFNYDDAKSLDPSELREILEMAISDFEPNEAAEILLQYKLNDKLNSGQIQNLSNEMLEDNESEEFPDISLHYPLFNINQLLHRSYNGKFPNAKATVIELELTTVPSNTLEITKAVILQATSQLLRKENLIPRLYEKELAGEKKFEDAEHIIWELKKISENVYTFITSDYWINKEDLISAELNGTINPYEDK